MPSKRGGFLPSNYSELPAMLTNRAFAYNMPLIVSALIVSAGDTVRVTPAGDVCDYPIHIVADECGIPCTLTASGGETFDDTNDAIAYASRGDDNTYAAYRITSNPNYSDDQFDLVIYSRVPLTFEHITPAA